MKQRIFGLIGMGACIVYVLLFGFEGMMENIYLKSSFAFMLLGSVFLISTDTHNG